MGALARDRHPRVRHPVRRQAFPRHPRRCETPPVRGSPFPLPLALRRGAASGRLRAGAGTYAAPSGQTPSAKLPLGQLATTFPGGGARRRPDGSCGTSAGSQSAAPCPQGRSVESSPSTAPTRAPSQHVRRSGSTAKPSRHCWPARQESGATRSHDGASRIAERWARRTSGRVLAPEAAHRDASGSQESTGRALVARGWCSALGRRVAGVGVGPGRPAGRAPPAHGPRRLLHPGRLRLLHPRARAKPFDLDLPLPGPRQPPHAGRPSHRLAACPAAFRSSTAPAVLVVVFIQLLASLAVLSDCSVSSSVGVRPSWRPCRSTSFVL